MKEVLILTQNKSHGKLMITVILCKIYDVRFIVVSQRIPISFASPGSSDPGTNLS